MNTVTTNKIKLVVVNENILGYIFPELPNTIQILHASILKGANAWHNGSSISLTYANTLRLANENDFNDFRVVFNGYKNNPEYLHA